MVSFVEFLTRGKFVGFCASNSKFGISLNKVFLLKNFLVIFVLLFIASFQVASDFCVNLTNLHVDFKIQYTSAFACAKKLIGFYLHFDF